MEKTYPRREFLANIAMAGTLFAGLGLAASYVFRFLIPTKLQRSEKILLERLSRLAVGESRPFNDVLGNDLIALRVSEQEVKVFSSTCPHLGCHVQWDPVAKNFLCPCHMGRFDTDGQVIAGPPPAPLPMFPTTTEGDNIFVVVPVEEA